MENLPLYLAAALAVSEGMALIPQLKGNGIVDMILKGLKLVNELFGNKPQPKKKKK